VNTPAHAIANLLILGRRERPETALPIVLGAILPDVPILLFYAWAKLARGLPESTIWTTAYYEPAWQNVIDGFHSLPLILLALLAAYLLKAPRATALFASMALHVPEDLLLHAEDAHRHLYPFSDWRFQSPLSYWNPAHHGRLLAPLEALYVLCAAVVLARRYRTPWVRALLAGVVLLYAGYLGYVLWVWV